MISNFLYDKPKSPPPIVVLLGILARVILVNKLEVKSPR